MKRFSFRISELLFERMTRHLFPGDNDEHGAVLIAGIAEGNDEVRLLARDLIIARDGIDFVPGKFGYRAFTADFVARLSNKCAREQLAYFSVHNHGGDDSVGFSKVDLESHKRGYPALLDITRGGPVGGLVFARNAVAGEIWRPTGVSNLDGMIVTGMNTQRLYPKPKNIPGISDRVYHRQSLMFGSIGQFHLKDAKVGIIGLGGVGSLVNEYLARLGVGEIVGIDFDKVERSNRSRIVGSNQWDSSDWLAASGIRWIQRIGEKIARTKVSVAKRVARQANPRIEYRPVVGDITDQQVANQLRDADFMFLCADSMQSRLVFNALVHQYLIPGVQIGSKVSIDTKSGRIGNVFSVARFILPEQRGGCLLCNGLISADMLQEEALSNEERRQQKYVEDDLIAAPSVITLNAVGAAQATNQFLFHFLGLFDHDHVRRGYSMYYARENVWRQAETRSDDSCLHCGVSTSSVYGRGDRASLPCKGR
jgi:hypothetical protein